MALSIQVGQTGTLKLTPLEVGIDPAAITAIDWVQSQGAQNVRLTQPDQIEGLSAGPANFKVSVTLGPGEKISYVFTINCTLPGPVPIEPVVPVVIDNLVTPPPPETRPA